MIWTFDKTKSLYPSTWRGLIGAWPILIPTGSTVFDVSGRHNNGTLTNMEPGTDWLLSRNRKIPAYALEFGGTDETVDFGNIDIFNFGSTQSFSVMLWGYIESPSANEVLVGKKASQGSTGQGFVLEATTGPIFRFKVSDSVNQVVITGGTPTAQTWHHLVYIVDRGAQEHSMYVDSTAIAPGSISTVGSVSSSTQLRFGAYGGGASSLTGRLGDVRIYNRILTSKEIQFDYLIGASAYRLRPRRAYRAPAAAAGEPEPLPSTIYVGVA